MLDLSVRPVNGRLIRSPFFNCRLEESGLSRRFAPSQSSGSNVTRLFRIWFWFCALTNSAFNALVQAVAKDGFGPRWALAEPFRKRLVAAGDRALFRRKFCPRCRPAARAFFVAVCGNGCWTLCAQKVPAWQCLMKLRLPVGQVS